MTLDVAAVLEGTGAHLVRLLADGTHRDGGATATDLARPFTGVSIDSRSISPDALFVALPGERTDGHSFVKGALAAGARGCIVSKLPPLDGRTDGAPQYLFVVPDVLAALQALATFWRMRHNARVIGVTGSIGKTTTKDILAAVLGTRWPVLRSEANLNTEIGLPLMLLRLRERHRAGVFEMGMHASGDIALLAEIARPHTGVVTNVAPVHLERMGSIEAIAREKSRLVHALPPSGLAVLNADDPWTLAMARTGGTAEAVTVGLSESADYRARDVTSHGLEGFSLVIEAEGCRLRVNTRIPGTHTTHALLATAAVARSMGMDWNEVTDALGTVTLESRQRLVTLRPDVLLIDDAYNAAPLSVLAALDLLAGAKGMKIGVLGDMLELGPGEENAHKEIGARAAELLDWLVVRGERADWIADEAIRRGLDPQRVVRPGSNAAAAQHIRSIIGSLEREPSSTHRMHRQSGTNSEASAGVAILIKGSRGMRMEEIVQDLERNAP